MSLVRRPIRSAAVALLVAGGVLVGTPVGSAPSTARGQCVGGSGDVRACVFEFERYINTSAPVGTGVGQRGSLKTVLDSIPFNVATSKVELWALYPETETVGGTSITMVKSVKASELPRPEDWAVIDWAPGFDDEPYVPYIATAEPNRFPSDNMKKYVLYNATGTGGAATVILKKPVGTGPLRDGPRGIVEFLRNPIPIVVTLVAGVLLGFALASWLSRRRGSAQAGPRLSGAT